MLWGVHIHHGLWQTGQETAQEAAQKLVNELGQLGLGGFQDSPNIIDVVGVVLLLVELLQVKCNLSCEKIALVQ